VSGLRFEFLHIFVAVKLFFLFLEHHGLPLYRHSNLFMQWHTDRSSGVIFVSQPHLFTHRGLVVLRKKLVDIAPVERANSEET
jgi:hypothetical protein